jgi:predicted ATPase/DNA-binding NarL/FixJ family response regulator
MAGMNSASHARTPRLPAALTRFIGRERELVAVRHALARTRLLTLTGAGGCGKTRLAAQAAAEQLHAYPGGVWWTDLAPLAARAPVEWAIAEVVGVRPLPGQTALQAVAAHLGDAPALVVLDNCEHLVADAARCAEALLRACSRLVVLATSRVPLGVAGETQWRVPSLTLPPPGAADPCQALQASDAARLFVDRARDVRSDFAPTSGNARAIAQICCDLDGIPLAIELAAARVRVLPVEAIAAGLEDRFRLLTGGPRAALPRHRTLRASVEWSLELLDTRERVLLRRLGVFRGGWTLAAAEAVCAGKDLLQDEILDVLSSLVDKSLVNVEHAGASVRYRLLETMRQAAAEQLAASGEAEALADRHRDLLLAMAEHAASRMVEPDGRAWLDVLDPEAANLAAALDRAVTSDPTVALRLCAALTFWWKLRGRFAGAEEALSRALAAAAATPSRLRARVLWARAYLACYAAEVETAAACAQQALAMAERLGEHDIAARALDVLATLETVPNPGGARAIARRSRELAAAAGDAWCLCDATQVLAFAHLYCGERGQATALLDDVLPLVGQTGSAELAAWHWAGHAMALEDTAETQRCRSLAERAMACADEVGEVTSGAVAAATLAHLEIRQGRADAALDRVIRHEQHAVAAGAGLGLPLLRAQAAAARLSLGLVSDAEADLADIVAGGADGVVQGLATAHALLAEIGLVRGDPAAVRRHNTEFAALGRHLGAARLRAWSAHIAGRLATAEGQPSAAERHLHDALALDLQHGHDLVIPDLLDALAEVAAALDSPVEATRLLAGAARARDRLGIVRFPPDGQRWAALARALHARLGEAAYQAAYAEGHALELAELTDWIRRGRGTRRRPATGWESLTPIEQQVVALATAGLNNRDIGERLFIARGTVKIHLSHVYAKLDVHNRAELAALATRRAGSTTSPLPAGGGPASG